MKFIEINHIDDTAEYINLDKVVRVLETKDELILELDNGDKAIVHSNNIEAVKSELNIT